MIRGLQCSSKQRAAGLPNKMAYSSAKSVVEPFYRSSAVQRLRDAIMEAITKYQYLELLNIA